MEFTNITTLTLCGLVEGVASTNAFVGTINYANADVADKAYTLPMALTISAQRSLLPVTAAVLTANPCLRALPWIVDLTVMVEMRTRADAQQCVTSPFRRLFHSLCSRSLSHSLDSTRKHLHTNNNTNPFFFL